MSKPKHTCTLPGARFLTGALALLTATVALCAPPEPHAYTVARKFSEQQQQQLTKFSEFLKVAPPPAYTNLLALLADPATDPLTLGPQFAELMGPASATNEPRVAAMRHIVHEAVGATVITRQWPPDLLELFVRDLLNDIPDGSIYLCSSDEGRFAFQAYHDQVESPRVLIVSYNRLNDASYISYLRWLHGDKLILPQRDDVSRAMQQYVKETSEGTSPFPGGVVVTDGKVRLTGPGSSAAINSKLAQTVWRMNSATHPIMAEVDAPLPWLYPHAVPQGLLLRIAPTNPPNSTLVVRRSELFWKRRLTPATTAITIPARRFARLRQAQAEAFSAADLSRGAERAFVAVAGQDLALAR